MRVWLHAIPEQAWDVRINFSVSNALSSGFVQPVWLLNIVKFIKHWQGLCKSKRPKNKSYEMLVGHHLDVARCCFMRCCFSAQRFFAIFSNQQSYGALSWTCFCRCSPYFTENGNQTWNFGSGQFQFEIIQVESFKFWKSSLLWINEVSHSYKVLITICWSIKWKAVVFFKECQKNDCCIGPKSSVMLPI